MPSYLVIRLVPDSPVDAATFGTYLDGLELQVLDANTLQPRSDFVYYSPLALIPNGGGSLSFVSVLTAGLKPYDSKHSNDELTLMFFFSSRRRHTRCLSDWSSDVCSS